MNAIPDSRPHPRGRAAAVGLSRPAATTASDATAATPSTPRRGSSSSRSGRTRSAQNPRTKSAYSGSTALCLGCHEESSKGGQGYAPVAGHISHPYGLASVNSKVANVPADLLRGGRFECVGCHDPHPSNPNHKYLRVDTAKGQTWTRSAASATR